MSNDNQPINPAFCVEENGEKRALRVAVCIPSFDTWKADTSMALIGLGTYTMSQGIALAFVNEKSSMVSKARNSLSEKSLGFGADYILFVDSDLVFPHDSLCRLISHGKDIIGATYNKRVPPFETLGHFIGEKRDLSTGGVIEADYMPGGFMLIKTDVLKALPQPWFFETYYRTPEDATLSALGIFADQYREPMPVEMAAAIADVPGVKDWLQEQRKDAVEFDARYMSEDYNFCRKARKAGFQIWCDLDLTFQMAHIGEQHVTCAAPAKQAAAPGTQNIDLSAA
jgi:cellulose synthase/poly-beta-1,6-N-acetylglucosamine synthase-like glycosyltransferase